MCNRLIVFLDEILENFVGYYKVIKRIIVLVVNFMVWGYRVFLFDDFWGCVSLLRFCYFFF